MKKKDLNTSERASMPDALHLLRMQRIVEAKKKRSN